MPLKRKIPSRKFSSSPQRRAWPSRPFANRSASKPASNSAGNSAQGAANKSPDKPTNKPTSKSPSSNTSRPGSAASRDTGRGSEAAEGERPASLAECFWDMGFESIPTVEELQKRYRELSLVLHPDARGTKESFQKLRIAYETALALLESS